MRWPLTLDRYAPMANVVDGSDKPTLPRYLMVAGVPVLLGALRVIWTLWAVDAYQAGTAPYSRARAEEWYRYAFTYPETVLAAALFVFVLLIAVGSETRRRGYLLTAGLVSLAAYLVTLAATFNAAFANFKEIIG